MLQKCHKKGSGGNIHPQPLMDVVVKKTNVKKCAKKETGCSVLAYDHEKRPSMIVLMSTHFKPNLQILTLTWVFSHILSRQGSAESVEIIASKFEETPVSYQHKCPSTKFNVTPLDACSDQNFFMQKLVAHVVD